ncbi:hypothetical protein [Streptomyces sp. NPDC046909]|uniref:hypothetical protein n=1 Tax=Streptomyces sp. NPDC046909 TaxID=3155617 RepID=UPI0033CD9D2B
MVVLSSKFFFREVCAVYEEVAQSLHLSGPDESEDYMPSSEYRCGELLYAVNLNQRAGLVSTTIRVDKKSIALSMDIEEFALSVGLVERRGGISTSARSQKQLRKSLLGQVAYVELVHPLLSDGKAEEAMLQAGARRWR